MRLFTKHFLEAESDVKVETIDDRKVSSDDTPVKEVPEQQVDKKARRTKTRAGEAETPSQE